MASLVLSEPYASRWARGYLVFNKSTGRRTVILYNSKEDRSSTPYARYLLGTKLGRYLTDTEYADHSDRNRINDSEENLRIETGTGNNFNRCSFTRRRK